MRQSLGAILALACLVVSGCGSAADEGDSAARLSIPVGEPSYDANGPTWALGRVIHIGDTLLDVAPRPEAYVVTRRGVYYTARGALYFTDGGAAEEVAEIGSAGLAINPAGDRLALVDRAHGPTDEFGTHVAVPVVFDLETGQQVLRGEPGRSLDGEDLADLYEEIAPYLLGVDDEAVYAVDPLREGDDQDQWRFPLDGGNPKPMDGDPVFQDELGTHGWAEPLPRGRYRWDPARDGEVEQRVPAVLSPSQDVIFVDEDAPPGPGRYFDAETGEATTFSETPFDLGGWVDDDTFYGAFSSDASAEGPAGPTTMASCDVRTRPICTPLAPEFDLQLGQQPGLLFGTGRPAHLR